MRTSRSFCRSFKHKIRFLLAPLTYTNSPRLVWIGAFCSLSRLKVGILTCSWRICQLPGQAAKALANLGLEGAREAVQIARCLDDDYGLSQAALDSWRNRGRSTASGWSMGSIIHNKLKGELDGVYLLCHMSKGLRWGVFVEAPRMLLWSC